MLKHIPAGVKPLGTSLSIPFRPHSPALSKTLQHKKSRRAALQGNEDILNWKKKYDLEHPVQNTAGNTFKADHKQLILTYTIKNNK